MEVVGVLLERVPYGQMEVVGVLLERVPYGQIKWWVYYPRKGAIWPDKVVGVLP